jgi:hypothetical protein
MLTHVTADRAADYDSDRSTNALLVDYEASVPSVSRIPIHLSYEIIHLFSEGLYQSPQKAIEELVSNSYDAGATVVHILLPAEDPSIAVADAPHQGEAPWAGTALWVIDNGTGLDADGFVQLWRVADSHKLVTPDPPAGRP